MRPGYGYRRWTREELTRPTPPPEFDARIEAVRERIAKIVRALTVPRNVRVWHPAIQRLLTDDEARREKQRASSFSGEENSSQIERISAWPSQQFQSHRNVELWW